MKGLRVMGEDSGCCAGFCAEPKMLEEGELGRVLWKWVLGVAEGAAKENALGIGVVELEIGDGGILGKASCRVWEGLLGLSGTFCNECVFVQIVLFKVPMLLLLFVFVAFVGLCAVVMLNVGKLLLLDVEMLLAVALVLFVEVENVGECALCVSLRINSNKVSAFMTPEFESRTKSITISMAALYPARYECFCCCKLVTYSWVSWLAAPAKEVFSSFSMPSMPNDNGLCSQGASSAATTH